MKRLVIGALIAAMPLANGFACGDKYVVLGRGVRFQRAYAASLPASILVYAPPAAKWASGDTRERLLSTLRLVGHRPDAVSTADELDAALRTGRYDVVLTDFTTLTETSRIGAAAATHPTVIPVVFDPSRGQLAEIEKQNSCVVQFSKRSHELLTIINIVMEERAKGVKEACQRKVV